MNVYFLQTCDYEPAVYGVFSSREKVVEHMKTIESKWIDAFEIVTYEVDRFLDGWTDNDQHEIIYVDKPKKPSKWRT